MAGRCPKGHRLESLGSIAHPLPPAANVSRARARGGWAELVVKIKRDSRCKDFLMA